MFKLLHTLDGSEIAIKSDSILAVYDEGTHRLICTPFEEYEVQESMQDIFKMPLSGKIEFSIN